MSTKPPTFTYTVNERLPVEVLVFRVAPEHVDEFIAVDHEVWTLGEALLPGFEKIPFRSKEVWIDDAKPGEVTLTFGWESLDDWLQGGEPSIQALLQAEFDRRFPPEIELVAAPH
jgi:uncharacterized protein (TIGR03792 family)